VKLAWNPWTKTTTLKTWSFCCGWFPGNLITALDPFSRICLSSASKGRKYDFTLVERYMFSKRSTIMIGTRKGSSYIYMSWSDRLLICIEYRWQKYKSSGETKVVIINIPQVNNYLPSFVLYHAYEVQLALLQSEWAENKIIFKEFDKLIHMKPIKLLVSNSWDNLWSLWIRYSVNCIITSSLNLLVLANLPPRKLRYNDVPSTPLLMYWWGISTLEYIIHIDHSVLRSLAHELRRNSSIFVLFSLMKEWE